MRTWTAPKMLSKDIKVSTEIQHTTCIFSNQIEWTCRHPRMESNIDMVHNNKHVHKIPKNK